MLSQGKKWNQCYKFKKCDSVLLGVIYWLVDIFSPKSNSTSPPQEKKETKWLDFNFKICKNNVMENCFKIFFILNFEKQLEAWKYETFYPHFEQKQQLYIAFLWFASTIVRCQDCGGIFCNYFRYQLLTTKVNSCFSSTIIRIITLALISWFPISTMCKMPLLWTCLAQIASITIVFT